MPQGIGIPGNGRSNKLNDLAHTTAPHTLSPRTMSLVCRAGLGIDIIAWKWDKVFGKEISKCGLAGDGLHHLPYLRTLATNPLTPECTDRETRRRDAGRSRGISHVI